MSNTKVRLTHPTLPNLKTNVDTLVSRLSAKGYSPRTLEFAPIVLSLRKANYQEKQIHQELNGAISTGSISNILIDSGMGFPRVNGSLPEVLKLAKRNGKDQLGQATIAAAVGVTQQTISRVSIANGHRRVPTKEELEARNERILADAPDYEQKQLAKRYGLSVKQISLILRGAKVTAKTASYFQKVRAARKAREAKIKALGSKLQRKQIAKLLHISIWRVRRALYSSEDAIDARLLRKSERLSVAV